MLEWLRFTFECVDDHYRSADCQNLIDLVPKGSTCPWLLSRYIASFVIRGYESVDGKLRT